MFSVKGDRLTVKCINEQKKREGILLVNTLKIDRTIKTLKEITFFSLCKI